jgi:hypothetical protein
MRERRRIDRCIICRRSIQFSMSVSTPPERPIGPTAFQSTIFGISGDLGNLISGGTPPPPIPIPDWRGFERVHPKSSQIGVDFSNLASIGADFRAPTLFLIYAVVTSVFRFFGDDARSRRFHSPSPYHSTRIPKNLHWSHSKPSQIGVGLRALDHRGSRSPGSVDPFNYQVLV